MAWYSKHVVLLKPWMEVVEDEKTSDRCPQLQSIVGMEEVTKMDWLSMNRRDQTQY